MILYNRVYKQDIDIYIPQPYLQNNDLIRKWLKFYISKVFFLTEQSINFINLEIRGNAYEENYGPRYYKFYLGF